MNASRPAATGKTRTCPHCKATILESLSICPGCLHHLRFDSEAAKRQVEAKPALQVEGIIRHPPADAPVEYFVVIGIRNERGEEVTRQVVNVGLLQSGEKRAFSLSVEVLPTQAAVATTKAPATTTQPGAGVKAPAVASPPNASVKPPPGATAATGGTGTFKSPAPAAAKSPPPPTVPSAKSPQPQGPAAQGPAPKASSPKASPQSPASSNPGSAPKVPSPNGPKRH